VEHLCPEGGNTETFQSFMREVHLRFYKWKQYWGEDCKSLLTTLGLDMNVEPIIVTKEGSAPYPGVLCRDLLSRILNLLSGETTISYRERILGPKDARGDYPELVAAGQVWNRHIVIMQPAPSQNTMTETRFELAGREFRESNTAYLVRVNDNHYHACHFRHDVQCDTLARLLLPNGFYVEEMEGVQHVSSTCTCVETRFRMARICT
jgi:hypothetical protein